VYSRLSRLDRKYLAVRSYTTNMAEDYIFPSIEFDQADVREAVRDVFKHVGAAYSLAPEVQGLITLSLRNITFEAVLQDILRQVDATYRVEGGVYQIVRRESPLPGS
jgi:type II secretory pathway component GspD/PulD (secretin)